MSLLYLILFVSFVILSAFFSSAETSILSLNKIKLNIKARKGGKKEQLIKNLLDKPQRFFSTILLGNNLVNIAAATVSTAFFSELFLGKKELILIYSTVFTTVIILVFSELIPKTLALHYNEKISRLYISPLKFIYYLFLPFVWVLSYLSKKLAYTPDDAEGEKHLTPEEIKYFLRSEIPMLKYNAEVLRMLTQMIDITQKDIKNSMIPRMDIQGIEVSTDKEKLIDLLKKSKYAQYPVYQDNLDQILGFVERDDLLWQLIENGDQNFSFGEMLNEPVYLSEYSSINYALKYFKRQKKKTGIIVDEYGMTIGLITLRDIVNEIVGDLQLGRTTYARITNNIFIVSGEEPIFRVNEKLQVSLPNGTEYTTLSGLFLFYYGKIPKIGSKIEIGKTILSIKKMDDRRISRITIEKF